MKRIKFRIHGGSHPGKFAYNVPEGKRLNLNAAFRPVGGQEIPAYSLETGESRTRITFHHGGDSWNGKKIESGTYDVRVGHILTSAGVTVEILDCPEPAAAPGRETTQFLDLRAVSPEPDTREVHAPAEVNVEVPLVESAAIPSNVVEESEIEDKIVVPVSFIPTPEATRDLESNKATVTPTPLPPVPRAEPAEDLPPRFATKKIPAPETSGPDPMKLRRASLQRAGMVASGFVVAIVVANQVAQHYYIDIPVPEPVVINVTQTPARAPAPAAVPVAEAEVVPLPVMAQGDSSRAPASAEEAPPIAPAATEATDAEKGAKLAAAGKDLMAAVEEGNLKLVTKLVEVDGVSPDFTIDDNGRSPFVRAASAGRVSVMQFLLTKKVAKDAVDFNGNNALMWSAINGHEKTAAFLLSLGLNPSAKREDGKTALQLAKQYRQRSIEKLLVRSLASVKGK